MIASCDSTLHQAFHNSGKAVARNKFYQIPENYSRPRKVHETHSHGRGWVNCSHQLFINDEIVVWLNFAGSILYSYGPVSVRVCVCVCLSVTSRSSTKTAKRRITQTTPNDSPGTPVFWCQRSPRNSTGVTPYGGTKCRWGGSKSATFHK